MTDAAFLLSVLADHRPHSLREILARSFAERGVGLTVHSRASDLRKRGHVVTVTQQRGATFRDRPDYFYRLARRTELRPADSEESGSTGDRGSVGRVPTAKRLPPEHMAPSSVPACSPLPSLTTSAVHLLDGSTDEPETRPLFDLSNRPIWA